MQQAAAHCGSVLLAVESATVEVRAAAYRLLRLHLQRAVESALDVVVRGCRRKGRGKRTRSWWQWEPQWSAAV